MIIKKLAGDHGTVSKFTCSNLAKFMHQNKGEYTGDFVDGVLLDNFIVATKRGYAAFLETYVNPNMSTYTVYFQKGAAADIWKLWDAYTSKVF